MKSLIQYQTGEMGGQVLWIFGNLSTKRKKVGLCLLSLDSGNKGGTTDCVVVLSKKREKGTTTNLGCEVLKEKGHHESLQINGAGLLKRNTYQVFMDEWKDS
ncbi:hypothetical protein WN48_04653 [Eufriesea mexicana]|uniref:Uncharacterized protein n=1 Tax=Eufriesea mexicana TaxID=516756 RepID=A0A310SBW2_9HYME|nr:hypothetical protein WN48_04653 [Eufriesea mexicana]